MAKGHHHKLAHHKKEHHHHMKKAEEHMNAMHKLANNKKIGTAAEEKREAKKGDKKGSKYP